jgi:hypothetical protein
MPPIAPPSIFIARAHGSLIWIVAPPVAPVFAGAAGVVGDVAVHAASASALTRTTQYRYRFIVCSFFLFDANNCVLRSQNREPQSGNQRDKVQDGQ